MKAAVIHEFDGIDSIQIEEIPKPTPKSGEALIKTAYAAINPVDWKISEGHLKKMMEFDFPIVLGWDVSGIIESGGEDSGFQPGDEVYAYCRKSILKDGSFAEYVSFDAKDIAPKPKSLSMAQAASIPLTALTAWQALFEFADLKKGQSILIHAGAGGVGGMAIQFAKIHGARVYTTASASNHEYVKRLGADVAIDYKNEDFDERIKELEPNGVDVVLEAVGEESMDKSLSCIKKGGCLASITSLIDEEKGKNRGVKTGFVFVRPDGKQLRTIAELFDSGKLTSPEIHEFSFSEVKQALSTTKEGHNRGKLVLRFE